MSLSLQEQYDKIYRYCYFKVKNQHLAEDLTQETFLRFFNQSNYISRGKQLAYLYTIARNMCIDIYRKPIIQDIPKDTAATHTIMEGVETTIVIREALDLLPHDMQEIILLRYVNDLSMKEISIITGISRFAIRRKINGALSQLKQVLRKEDFL